MSTLMKMPAMPAARTMMTPTNAGVRFGKIQRGKAGMKVLLYGESGIGKTTLACRLPGPVGFLDLEGSLGVLDGSLKARGIDGNVFPVECEHTWEGVCRALEAPGWEAVKSVVLDSGTRAEALCVDWTVEHCPMEKGGRATTVESYGYGKGYALVYANWQRLLAALDAHAAAGRNVCIVCHDCTCNVPNPAGDDWLRYEPRLQAPTSGKASIRLEMREWCDVLAFIALDINVDKGRNEAHGKGQGGGTRTAYLAEQPFCMAKCRVNAPAAVAVGDDGEFWKTVLK